MAAMPKTAVTSEARRSSTGISWPEGSQALAAATEAWFSATAECQREAIGFISKRLDKDGETIRAMMSCKDPADIAAIQSRWMEEALRDYSNEAGKLMTICIESVKGGSGSRR
ncbi:phasin family protein [Microvirga sp. 2YAF29]|uniref:phasin family protein n=1 Tax=Microvirga sp. 2YAF29 TaxID=3233031 RepID=UPI003F94CEB2